LCACRLADKCEIPSPLGREVLLEFDDPVRVGGGELRPMRPKLSRWVSDGGKWLEDMLGREKQGDESAKISCNLRTFVAGAL